MSAVDTRCSRLLFWFESSGVERSNKFTYVKNLLFRKPRFYKHFFFYSNKIS